MKSYTDIENKTNDELIDTVQNKSWSEEDESMFECIKWSLVDLEVKEQSMGKFGQEIAWLKSLKDRVQPLPKQDWSEEDLCKIENALFGTYAVDVAIRLLNKIKFLKPLSQWKPGEKQMKALKEAVDEHWEPDGLDPLYTLWEQLKKLKY